MATDVLDEDFDLDTFELSEITFANQTIPVPYGLSRYQTQIALIGTNTTAACELLAGYPGAQVDWLNGCVLVDVIASLDRATRTLTLRLDAFDPVTGWWPEDPLVGLLPPNDSTGRGEGSISYLVRPKAGLPSGTRIENRARIVFDYNDPIDTPLVFNTIDSGAPSSRVSPIVPPAFGTNIFAVTWTAEDDPDGSGVATVDLYGSSDGTNYVRWAQGLTNEVAFAGTYGSMYSLFTVARDHVGNEEAWPAAPDATVYIPRAIPEIESVTVESDGSFRLHALGEPGIAYAVEASSDLVQWTEIAVVTAGESGKFEFPDPDSADLDHRFYCLRGP